MKGIIICCFALSLVNPMVGQEGLDVKKIHAAIKNEATAGHFSGTILIGTPDNRILVQSEGFADKENNIRNSPDTRYNIASTGKLLTRIVILQLIQEGSLSFDDTFGKIYPLYKDDPIGKVTIRQLLNHQAGLGDVYVNKQYLRRDVYTSPGKVIQLIAQEKLAFDPGTSEEYSNSGYYLLGEIIAKITGKTFAESIQELIFKPLRMKNSGSANVGDVVTNHAIPYRKNGKRSEPTTIGEPPSGAGSQYSTVEDLYNLFYSIIKDNRLLSEDSKALLFNKFEPGNWQEILGSGKITGYLGGDTRGWSSKMTFLFSSGEPKIVIILANYDDQAHPLDLKVRDLILTK